MNMSNDYVTNYVLRHIESQHLIYLEQYVMDMLNRSYIEFNNYQEIGDYFGTYLDKYSASEKELIRYYTGIAFRDINAVSRNNWNYNTNGLNSKEKETESRKLAFDLDKIIDKSNPLQSNIVCYRGVSLSSFKRFGINSIEELLNLKNQYIFESGFTSTSLLRNSSFFDRDLEYHSRCDIEIKFLIPEESRDGIALIDKEVSYSPEQAEYLISKGSLQKIVDVKLSSDKKKAFITVVYIPKRIWDRTKEIEENIKQH